MKILSIRKQAALIACCTSLMVSSFVSAQSLNMSQTETLLKKSNASSQASAASAFKFQNPALKNDASENKKPEIKIIKPQWFNPEFQKKLMGGVVTGGGDEEGQKIQALAAVGLIKLKRHFTPEENQHIQEALKKARFVVVDEKVFASLPGVKQESLAINNKETGIVQYSRERLKKVKTSQALKANAAHEVLSLIEIESTGQYPYTHTLLTEDSKGTQQAGAQKDTLLSEYTGADEGGYHWESAYRKCQQTKALYEGKYYLVYCSYLEKRLSYPAEERWKRYESERFYGLIVYGIGESSQLKWKTVFSSLKYGRGGSLSDTFSSPEEAKEICEEALQEKNSSWTSPRCIVKKQKDQYYYEIQTQNPLL